MEEEVREQADVCYTWLSKNWTSGTRDAKIGVEMLHLGVISRYLILILLNYIVWPLKLLDWKNKLTPDMYLMRAKKLKDH